MKITPIASGSSGNCICISHENKGILIDAGISRKKIEEGLEFAGLEPECVEALFVTHEHVDHIKGLGVFLRKHSTPVFATAKTIDEILKNGSLGKVDVSLFNVINPGEKIMINGLAVEPFSVSHDAADPVAYRFVHGDNACAVATDLGYYDDYIVENLKNLDTVYLEANHDVYMLQTGPYPYRLKQRVWGRKGHLSNEDSGRLLARIATKKLKNVILGHLSKENNYPELAYEAVRNEVNVSDSAISANDFNMVVARRDEPTQTVNVGY